MKHKLGYASEPTNLHKRSLKQEVSNIAEKKATLGTWHTRGTSCWVSGVGCAAVLKLSRWTWIVWPAGARRVHGVSSEPHDVSSVTTLAKYWSATPDLTGTTTDPVWRHSASVFDTTIHTTRRNYTIQWRRGKGGGRGQLPPL